MDDLRRTIETLSAFPTRHSASVHAAQASDWIANEMTAIPGMRVERMRFPLAAGPRVPFNTEVEQIIGILPGLDPAMVGVGAHLDTINMADPRSLNLPAPGANDDASGIAAMLRTARVWAASPRRKTGLFVAFTGEEQGLLGAKALAERMVQESWPLEAFLNLDMISNTGAEGMEKNDREIRVHSDEGSRELARYAAFVQSSSGDPFRIKLVLRPDRIRRGGDHTPLAQAGFRAVRFTEAVERYEVQHTPHDKAEFVDWAYLDRVASCVTRVATSLGDAEPSPIEVRAERLGQGTRLSWSRDGGMIAYWRDTRSAEWTDFLALQGGQADLAVNLDDSLFAVGPIGGVPVLAKT